jgi:hypothetical protein
VIRLRLLFRNKVHSLVTDRLFLLNSIQILELLGLFWVLKVFDLHVYNDLPVLKLDTISYVLDMDA